MKNIYLYWFRSDLRVTDNKALSYAATKENVAAMYIYDPAIINSDDFSYLHLDFINDSLKELSNYFLSEGSFLNIFHNFSVKVLNTISESYSIKSIITHCDTKNHSTHLRDNQLLNYCKKQGIKWNRFQNNGVVSGLKNRDGWSYKWNAEMKKEILDIPNVTAFRKLDGTAGIQNHKSLGVSKINYHKTIEGGEKSAITQLKTFLNKNGQLYSKHISSPLTAENSCSRLSSFLTYGNLSMRYIVTETRKRQEELREMKVRDGWLGSLSAFFSRLRWHCHFIQKLEMQPSLENKNMVRAFDKIRTDFNSIYFERWKSGQVGFPMVDACMRYLKSNGWINFRMRAMLVSFASYNLWLDWKKTSKYLARYFIDYEPGIQINFKCSLVLPV